MGTHETQQAVLRAVLAAGALTTRRVIQEHGPKPNWAPLLQGGHLREVHTVYGAVLAPTPRGRELHARAVPNAPYLAGPTSIADRAYQMDALFVLEQEGYGFARHEYKRSGGVGLGAGRTSQIASTVVRVPPHIEAGLRMDWGFVFAPRADAWGRHPEVLGYPRLYATISHGGIRLPRLRALYREHHLHIHEWRHPLLIAVPEEGTLRPFLRGLEQERARLDRAVPSRLLRFPYPLVRLIILPRPGGAPRGSSGGAASA